MSVDVKMVKKRLSWTFFFKENGTFMMERGNDNIDMAGYWFEVVDLKSTFDVAAAC